MRFRIAIVVALACAGAAGIAVAACPPDGWSREDLVALKAKDYAVTDAVQRQQLAVGLLDCLADPDPDLRDGIAFEALSTWLRANQIDLATRAQLLTLLEIKLQSETPDPLGVRAPFAALALSEVVRTDRIAPWLTPEQRERVVGEAAAYLRDVRDYRGFEDGIGWRHGVAHGADLLLQLALNPALDKAQLQRLLDAAASQVAPPGHFYIYGEGERLARAVWAIGKRGLLDDAAWQKFFDALESPAPMANWDAAIATQDGLARRHDARAFLLGLLALTEQDATLAKLAGQARSGLQKVP